MTECPRCGADLCEITALDDVNRVYLCLCGTGHRVTDPEFRSADSMASVPYGPAVPTPEDLMRAVGLDPDAYWAADVASAAVRRIWG